MLESISTSSDANSCRIRRGGECADRSISDSSMSLFEELKRRNVFRVAILYVVTGWLVLQMGDVLFELLGVPDWTLKFVFGLLILGLPFVLFFSWAYELTPEGLKKESEVDRTQSITPQTGKRLDRLALAVMSMVIIVLLIDRGGFGHGQQQGGETPSTGIERDKAPSSFVPTDGTTGADPPGGAASRAVPGKSVDQVSIAVLPFRDMSAAGDQAYFGEGIAEELLNALTRIDGLQVAGRTSSFAFRDSNADLTTIGSQLGVAHIVEGSVRKAGDRVRVTAQLVKAGDGFHLWSETYDRTLDDIFAIQDEITGEIMAALKENLPGLQSQAVDTTGTDSVEAYNAFLQGRYLLHQRGTENILRAQDLLRKAVELDPGFAEAHAQLARTLSVGWGVDEPERALESANRALELAPDSPIALMAYGGAEYRSDRISDAIAALERSLSMQPENPEAMHVLAGLLIDYRGDLDAAIDLEEKASEIDPTGVIYPIWLGMYQLGAGQVEAGLENMRKASDLAPDMSGFLAFASAVTGDTETARSMDPYYADSPFSMIMDSLCDAIDGKHDDARSRILENLQDTQGEDGAYAALTLLVAGDVASANQVMRDFKDSVMLGRWRLIFGYFPEIDIHATVYPEIMESRGMPMYVYPENPPARDE